MMQTSRFMSNVRTTQLAAQFDLIDLKTDMQNIILVMHIMNDLRTFTHINKSAKINISLQIGSS